MKDITARDGALSPVIAFLLLLMIVASFISLLNAHYIPSLKQQEEVKHLKGVEEMFCSITGDITSLAMLQRDSSLQKRISLGGGAVVLSPMTSSGTLQIEEETTLLSLVITKDYTDVQPPINITTVRIFYNPIGNFWVDQGYIWEQGLVNVTKVSRSTWLEHAKPENAKQAREFFIKSALMPQFLTNTSLSTYSITADPDSRFRSGNGMSGINIFMKGETRNFNNVTHVELLPAASFHCADPYLIDLETCALLNKLILAWKTPSFDGPTNLTVEEYNIMMQVA